MRENKSGIFTIDNALHRNHQTASVIGPFIGIDITDILHTNGQKC